MLTYPRAAAQMTPAILAALLLCHCAGSRHRSEGEAVIRGTENSGTQGVLRVHEANGGVHIRGMLMGLPPGPYALYVGQTRSCRPVTAAENLRGPLLLFNTDKSGSARIDLVSSELRPAPGGTVVLGRSLVVEQAFPAGADRHEDEQTGMTACGAVTN